MKLSALTAALAAGALLLAGCAPASSPGTTTDAPATITVTHTQGTTQLPATPKRIVALDLGAYDTLRSVGLGDSVVGLPKSGPVPTELNDATTANATDVGTAFEPNVEAINKLAPDLVIVGFRSAKHYPELSRYFPTIDVTYAQNRPFAEGVAYAAGIIGTATGTSAKVDEKLAELATTIAGAKEKTVSSDTAMVLMTTAGKVTAHGSVSRYGAIYRDLGYAPALAQVKDAAHGDPISFEAIKQANPGRLFVLDRDAAIGESGTAARQVLDNELVRATPAWTNGHVVYLTGTRWYVTIHGLDNAIAMIREVAAA